jgi:hypothetical protein
MKKVYYAVFDTKAKVYSGPFLEVTDGTAIRAIQDAVRSPDHPFARHAGDFSLHKIGTFDDQSGMIEGHEPQHIIDVDRLTAE